MKITIPANATPSEMLGMIADHFDRDSEALRSRAGRAAWRSERDTLEAQARYAEQQASFWRSIEVEG